jgi:hypothetical protein
MAKQPTIAFEIVLDGADSDVALINADAQLSESRDRLIITLPANSAEIQEEFLHRGGSAAVEVITALSRVHGLLDATLQPYSVELTKAPLFTWAHLSPQISAAMGKALGRKPSIRLRVR